MSHISDKIVIHRIQYEETKINMAEFSNLIRKRKPGLLYRPDIFEFKETEFCDAVYSGNTDEKRFFSRDCEEFMALVQRQFLDVYYIQRDDESAVKKFIVDSIVFACRISITVYEQHSLNVLEINRISVE